jgi:GTP-binding protein Era
MSFRSGFTGVIGPPNAGKSTLINRVLGRKIAIVSPKPQTTRNRIWGVLHGEDHQIVFVDTPGIHPTKTLLHKSMVASALAATREVDIILFLVEIGKADAPGTAALISEAAVKNKPCILAINKVDLAPRETVLPVIERLSALHPFDEIIPVSARTGLGMDSLLKALESRLKPGPPFFPPDMDTDQSETFMIAEIIREKIYMFTRSELPYSTAVTVNRIEEDRHRPLLSIWAAIHVETSSQKKIIIGTGGEMIKKIGTAARRELETMFDVRVYLDLVVKIEKNWSKNPKALRRLGY